MKKHLKKITQHFLHKKTYKHLEAQQKPKRLKVSLIKLLITSIVLIITTLIVAGKNSTIAEILVDEFVTALKGKVGFEYTSDPLSDYVFAKETPNYNAFAADKKLSGGHRMMLERDGVTMEIKFKSADLSKKKTKNLEDQSKESTEEARFNPLQSTLDELNSQLDEITNGLEDISKKISDIEKSVSEVTAKGKMIPEGDERKVLFQDIVFGTDLNYGLSEGGIKQEIILKDSSKVNNEFNFTLTHPDLNYEDVGNGVWYFTNKENKIMRIPKAYAIDANGKFTNDVVIEVKTTLLVTIMTVTVPTDWLQDTTRAYPVKIQTAFEIVPSLRDGTAKPLNSVEGISTEVTPTSIPVETQLTNITISFPTEATPQPTGIIPTIINSPSPTQIP